jgi:hypothetical protein
MTNEEKIEQERQRLIEEDLTKFPSIFQQARNLAKQAWISGTGVLQGKAFLTTAEKAYARLEICKTCEFFKDSRCLKCGCFMEKKAHVELATCPINKWGPELQVMLTQAQMDSYAPAALEIDLSKLSAEDAAEMKTLAEDALQKNKGMFVHKSMNYRAQYKSGNSGEYKIFTSSPSGKQRSITSHMTEEQRKALYDMAQQMKDPSGPKTFIYNGTEYRVTMIDDKRVSLGLASNPPPKLNT